MLAEDATLFVNCILHWKKPFLLKLTIFIDKIKKYFHILTIKNQIFTGVLNPVATISNCE